MSTDNDNKRTLYDYSRSDGGNHWYSGSDDPLRRQQDDEQPTAYKPDRNKIAIPTRQSTTRQRVQRRQQLRMSTPDGNWVVLVIAGVFFGLTAIIATLLFVVGGADENSSASAAVAIIEPTSVVYGEAGDALGEGNSLIIEPWQGGERFTVLLMGMDNRPDESELQCRTDTLIVVSIDPVTRSIGMLSIPRDTDVEVPGFEGLRKINTACVIGNLDVPGNGPRLTMQTIQYNFGIRVNEYVLINFDAFKSIVDRIGGIEVMVEQTIDDPEYPDAYYGYDPFYLEAGLQQLDGETALKYARTRYGTDDIDRGRRQQQIIFSMRDAVLDVGMMDNLAIQALPIWNDIEDGFDTDLSVTQMIELALFAAEIDLGNISNAVLDWNYLRVYIDENGDEYLIPDRGKLPELMTAVFGPGYNE